MAGHQRTADTPAGNGHPGGRRTGRHFGERRISGRYITDGHTCLRYGEPIRAKPPDEGPFAPARHRAKSKIAPHGQTMLARAAHLPPESGYFRSAWFSLGNDFRPKNFPRQAVLAPRCATPLGSPLPGPWRRPPRCPATAARACAGFCQGDRAPRGCAGGGA